MNSKIPPPEYMNDIHLIIDLGTGAHLTVHLFIQMVSEDHFNKWGRPIKPHKYILILF